MLITNFATAGLLGMIALSALSQAPSMNNDTGDREPLPRSTKASNIVVAGTKSNVASALSTPGLRDVATPDDYLRAARAALAAGRDGQARQSLEMAETRSPGGPDTPAQTEIRDALHALGAGDSARAMRIIDIALGG